MPQIPARLLTLVALAACSSTDTPPPPTPFNHKVDSLVAESMADGKVPGLAITIVRNDSVIHSKGYGFADLAAQRPMTDSTPVVIGSTSKTVTAFAVMQLVDEGKVALDSAIGRYVKAMQGATPSDARLAQATTRHLLTNVSGLPLGFSGDPYDGVDTTAGALERLMREEMMRMPLDFAPGKGFVYSNRGFSLASLVVQDASGMSYEDFIAERIFQPLGMRHSTGEFWRGAEMGRTTGYREGVDGKPVARRPATSREWTGSGMITSSSRDIGTFLRTILNEGRAPNGQQVLSAAAVAEMLRAQQPGESELGGPTTYALGWETNDMDGLTVIMKGGSVVSMGSLFVLLPQQEIGIAITFNLVDYGKVQLLQNLLKALLGAPTAPYQAAPPAEVVPPSTWKASAATLSSFAGSYMTRWGRLTIEVHGDSLSGTYEGGPVRFEPTSDTSVQVRSALREQEGTAITFRRCGGTTCLWFRGDSSGVKLD